MVARSHSDDLKGYDSFDVRLGDELRGERATLSKSLLDVQRDLRIKAAYIAAIENCDTSVFQNKGFVAGYVRSYARYLNLDAEVIFKRFCLESGFNGVNAGMTPKPHKKNAKALVSHSADKNRLVHPALRNRALQPSRLSGFSLSSLGSFGVLLVLTGGLGLGAWSILQDIQRVKLVPVDQTPGISAVVTTPEQPSIEPVAHIISANQMEGASDLLFSRVYRPQELEVPVLDHRDGPIAGIDPDQIGNFAGTADSEQDIIAGLVEMAVATETVTVDPQLVANNLQSVVSVFATNPAWIRVYLADGSRVFEKILETGEAYVLPADVAAPLLRAGNSGSVYLSVDNVAFGPIGTGTSVAKEISLEIVDIRANLPIAVEQTDVALQAVAAAEALALEQAPMAAVIPVAIGSVVAEPIASNTQ